MSREIKYRAWDFVKQEMRYDFLGKSGDSKGDWILFFKPETIEGKLVDGINNPYPRERFKLMQYTGLGDVNGKEIYEGDIVTGKPPHYTSNVKGVVQYGGLAFAFVGKTETGEKWFDTITNPLITKADDVEVIGNKFEDPELLLDGETP